MVYKGNNQLAEEQSWKLRTETDPKVETRHKAWKISGAKTQTILRMKAKTSGEF